MALGGKVKIKSGKMNVKSILDFFNSWYHERFEDVI